MVRDVGRINTNTTGKNSKQSKTNKQSPQKLQSMFFHCCFVLLMLQFQFLGKKIGQQHILSKTHMIPWEF